MRAFEIIPALNFLLPIIEQKSNHKWAYISLTSISSPTVGFVELIATDGFITGKCRLTVQNESLPYTPIPQGAHLRLKNVKRLVKEYGHKDSMHFKIPQEILFDGATDPVKDGFYMGKRTNECLARLSGALGARRSVEEWGVQGRYLSLIDKAFKATAMKGEEPMLRFTYNGPDGLMVITSEKAQIIQSAKMFLMPARL